ncbi:MAG TPA: TatD family hydrolase [Spirochaetia bacterium]|nr:TatD family hydrolase [Spirochaetia bacterium]
MDRSDDTPIPIDAHFHADDLFALAPGFVDEYRELGVLGLASVHDDSGFEATRRIMAGSRAALVSFGLHPQLPVMDEADALAARAASGDIAAVGECGFDFYGDSPETTRTPEAEAAQRAVFEYQLELAERSGLPVVLHLRRADDLLFEYAGRLARLRAVILHSWPGPANEALDFLRRCPRALFSFGLPLCNGNRKAAASAAALPASALLTETDAPYQPPRSPAPEGGRPLRAWSTTSDLALVASRIAEIRGEGERAVMAAVESNFREAFAHALR